MGEALLTIDDSPSTDTETLVSFLEQRQVPAVLFCRGDRLAANFAAAAFAVDRGYLLANHAYHHRRASQISLDAMKREIIDTEALIDSVYSKTGKARPVKYFRFPQMDRGTGGWVVDYNAVPVHKATLTTLFAEGLNINLDPPSAEQTEKKKQLQEFLKIQGFQPLPSSGISHEWFRNTEMATAVDAMFTFSTSDWMLTQRHLGKWPYKTLEDLKKKIDDDPWLRRNDSDHIILAHDQAELLPVVSALVDHFIARGFSFKCF